VKDASHVQWARKLLDDQLERLSELRNANPRDPGFKLWRQTTLTVIQRIWPGDLARCERFRRVPFSSTSPRQTRMQTREHFERGCAEASAYLRILTLELETQGLNKSGALGADPKPAQLPAELAQPPEPAAAEPPPHPHDMFEPSPFDRIQTPAPAKPAEATAPTPPPAPEPPAPTPPTPTPQASAPSPPAEAPKPSTKPAAPSAQKGRRSGRQGLKEMLGFGDDGSRAQADGPASFASPAPPPVFAGDHGREDVLDPRLEAMLAEAEEQAFGAELPPGVTPEPEVTPESEEPIEEPIEESADADEAVIDEPLASMPSPGDLPIEFLRKPQPMAAVPVATPPAMVAPPPAAAPPAPKPAAPPTSKPAPPAPAAQKPRPVVVKGAAPSPAPVARATEHTLPAWATPEAAVPSPAAAPPPTAPSAQAPIAPAAQAPMAPPAPPVEVQPTAPPVQAKPAAPAQPRAKAPAPAASPASSPTSAALMAIAGQVDRLGVPEGQCDAAREALIDFAKQLDERIASWDSIREILWIIADYPALARRTIPLLIPHLDLE